MIRLQFKYALGAISLMLGSIALSIILMEALTRLYDSVSIFRFPNFVTKELDMLKDVGDSNSYDPLLGWRLRENLVNRDSNPISNSITTGEFGVRMNSGSISPVPRNSILAVGDSFTFGSEVDDQWTWPAHLERLVRSPVVNAGNGGYGVDQIALHTEVLASKIKPKTIIVHILSQDIIRNAYNVFGGGSKPYFTVEEGKLVHQNYPVPRLKDQRYDLGQFQTWLGYLYIAHKLFMRVDPDWWVDNNLRNRQIMPISAAIQSSCLLMDRLARIRLDNNAKVVVGFVYGGGEISQKHLPPFVPPVIECAKKAGLEVLDFWDEFSQLSLVELKRLYVIHNDLPNIWGHMSSEGNLKVANSYCIKFYNCTRKYQ